MMAQTDTFDAGRSRWIPYAFVGFFGVVLAANAVMIWLAFTSWTGLETEHAYEEGLAYNDRLAEARQQAEVGWQVEVAFAKPGNDRLGIEVTLADRYGNPMEQAAIRAALVRPTHEGHDLTVALERRLANHYASDVALPLAGQWDVHLTIVAAGEVWQGSRRVFLRP